MPRLGITLQKAVAAAANVSRKEAGKLVIAGQVAVNGKTCKALAARVVAAQDQLQLNGAPPILAPEVPKMLVDVNEIDTAPLPRLWRYYKPAGLLTTHKDPEGRPTVFESLPPSLPRVVSVGRLDVQTEGLMLLTDSGQFARMLELPDAKVERLYEVQLVTGSREIDETMLSEIATGIVFADGTRLRKIDARVVSQGERRATLTMRLREGKKREVRRIWEEHFGFRVRRLQRRAFGPFQIGLLAPGEVKEVPPEEVRKMQAIARINLYRSKGDAQGKVNLPKRTRSRKQDQQLARAEADLADQADQADHGDGAEAAWGEASAGERELPERKRAAAPAAD